MKKKKAVGEFILDAQYRVPNTDSDLRKTKIDVWEERKVIILDFKIPLPIDKDGKLSILLTKKELQALYKEVIKK